MPRVDTRFCPPISYSHFHVPTGSAFSSRAPALPHSPSTSTAERVAFMVAPERWRTGSRPTRSASGRRRRLYGPVWRRASLPPRAMPPMRARVRPFWSLFGCCKSVADHMASVLTRKTLAFDAPALEAPIFNLTATVASRDRIQHRHAVGPVEQFCIPAQPVLEPAVGEFRQRHRAIVLERPQLRGRLQ